jgi:CHAT domain-containing protein/tetratricopeptide (TPR) repeat protein
VSHEEKHLSPEQIECLMESLLGVPGKGEQSELAQESRSHLANCQECQKLLSMHKKFDQALRRLKEVTPKDVTIDCPSEHVLSELAAGISNHEETENLLSHVSQCGHCGPVFRQAVENFRVEVTPDETSTIRSLKSSAPEWQKGMANRLAADVSKSVLASPRAIRPSYQTTPFSTMRWLYALAAILIIVLLTIGGREIWLSRPSYTEGLLAQAYSERRNMEVRISGGLYGPLRFGRGSRVSGDRPVALSEAEKQIRIELLRHPRSITWQQAKVRQLLLEGQDYDAPVRIAELAVDEGPPSPSLLNDLACAYFQKAEHEDTASAVEYGKAFESLSKSLALSPNEPVTLFNRAIVSQRLELYSQAKEDLQRYLVLDSDRNSEWHIEAASKLKDVEEILNGHKSPSGMALDNPEEMAADLASGQSTRMSEVDSRADVYQTMVIEEWMPQLMSGHILDGKTRDSLESALSLLAEDFRTRHNDSWLGDFLAARSPDSFMAVGSLAAALNASSKGDQEQAIQLSKVAEMEFTQERNEPGRIRARFERIYASHLAAHGELCHRDAVELLDVLKGRNYAWIETQTQLEAAACAQQISRIDESIARSRQALELARNAKYGNLELRATMFSVDPLPDPIERANSLIEALSLYWNGHYEPMRGYSLYASMDYTSGEDLQMWHLNEAVIKEGLHLLETDSDMALRGMETYRLAHAQLIVGELEEANRTVVEARRLLQQSESPALSAGAAVDMAEAFVINGRYRDALDLLGSAEPYLASLSQDIVAGKFYAVRAAALLGDGRSSESERSFVQALRIAHKALGGISDERDRYSWMQTLAPGYRSLAFLELQKNADASFRLWESFKGGSAVNAPDARGETFLPATREAALPSPDAWADGNTVFLSYASFPEGIAIWSYDGKRVEDIWLPGERSSIDQLAHRFHEACADPSSDPASLLLEGQELYQLLIKPAEGWMKGRTHLIVEPDSSMAAIPFEALVDENGKYLADSFEIEYSPGIAYLNSNKGSGRLERRSHALVVGQSLGDADEELPRLPGASEEARDVASKFDESVLLIDNEASIPRMVKELGRAQVFHFAGHALGTRQHNGLLLASSNENQESRFLDAGTFNSKLLGQSRLVVLSACSTANGTGTGIDDRESLARNILAAGVPKVVASRWVVDSIATREWMKSFYDQVLTNGDVGAAAGRARMIIRRTPKWQHPFYWASFSVFV